MDEELIALLQERLSHWNQKEISLRGQPDAQGLHESRVQAQEQIDENKNKLTAQLNAIRNKTASINERIRWLLDMRGSVISINVELSSNPCLFHPDWKKMARVSGTVHPIAIKELMIARGGPSWLEHPQPFTVPHNAFVAPVVPPMLNTVVFHASPESLNEAINWLFDLASEEGLMSVIDVETGQRWKGSVGYNHAGGLPDPQDGKKYTEVAEIWLGGFSSYSGSGTMMPAYIVKPANTTPSSLIRISYNHSEHEPYVKHLYKLESSTGSFIVGNQLRDSPMIIEGELIPIKVREQLDSPT